MMLDKSRAPDGRDFEPPDARPDPPPFKFSLHERPAMPRAAVSELYEPDLAGWAGEFTQSALDTGHRVGALARDQYPAGRLIDHDHLDHAGAEVTSRSALGDPAVPAIYEGDFSFDQVGIRADILTRTRDRRFDLVEVKSTLDLKPEHEWDVAVQLYVLEGARLPLRWVRLMHLNRDYVYPGGGYDLKQLFTFTNLTRRARKRRSDTVSVLKAIRRALAWTLCLRYRPARIAIHRTHVLSTSIAIWASPIIP